MHSTFTPGLVQDGGGAGYLDTVHTVYACTFYYCPKQSDVRRPGGPVDWMLAVDGIVSRVGSYPMFCFHVCHVCCNFAVGK